MKKDSILNKIIKVFLYICYGVFETVKFICYPFVYIVNKTTVSKKEKQNLEQEMQSLKKKDKKIVNKTEAKQDLSEYINKDAKKLKKSFSEKLNEKLEGMFEKSKNKKIQDIRRKKAQKLAEQNKLLNDGEDVKREKRVTWKYEAISPEGKRVIGYFDAYTKSDILSFLMSEELVVYKLTTNKLIQSMYASNTKHERRIKNKHLIFLITQLSTYLKSGIPLADAMGILVKQTTNKRRKRIFRNVKYELMLGESLSSAMEHQGKAFPSILINMVKSAELTGELPEVLDDMANYFTEMEETRKQMISALTYPSMVLLFTIGVMIFVMIYVVPKFVEIYDTMESAKVPKFTQAVINISAFFEKNIIFILLIFIGILLVIWYLYKHVKIFRTAFQYLGMKFPVIGNIMIYNEVAVFSKTFSSLLKHNVFITDSMEILTKVTNNEIYQSMILDTISNLSRGERISESFKNKWCFPIPAYEMIVTGEKTGQLAEMMDKVSVYYQELHRNSVTRVKALLEPIIIILLTFGVGAVVLAVVIPMFNMYETVQNMEG